MTTELLDYTLEQDTDKNKCIETVIDLIRKTGKEPLEVEVMASLLLEVAKKL